MFELIGISIHHEYAYGGWTGREDRIEGVVATFDSLKIAEEYIEKSRLKHPLKRDFPFKHKSLLSNCSYAEVRKQEEPEYIPHNPTI